MIKETTIRDRFLECLDTIKETNKEVAKKIGCNRQYLSHVRTAKNPTVKAAYIANLCLSYHFSPRYILLNQGTMKGQEPKSKEEAERDKLLDLIGKLMEGLLEIKASFNDPLSQLVNEAGKKINKQ